MHARALTHLPPLVPPVQKKKEQEKGGAGADDGGLDPEMAAMMGFSGFTGGK